MRLRLITALAALPALTAVALAAPEGPTTAPEKIAALTEDQPAAYVTDVQWIDSAELGAKIYSTAGGDPAINGLYTYLAIPGEMTGDGWKVFQIGDFNEWKVLQQEKDHIVLQVSRSWVDQASGDIKTVEEKLSVPLVGPDATEITVTPVK